MVQNMLGKGEKYWQPNFSSPSTVLSIGIFLGVLRNFLPPKFLRKVSPFGWFVKGLTENGHSVVMQTLNIHFELNTGKKKKHRISQWAAIQFHKCFTSKMSW